jgi:hypothetical protein
MNNQYDNTNRGALWDNASKKREGKNDPDFSGNVNVNGEEFVISAWRKEQKHQNSPVLSISVRPKVDAQGQSPSFGGDAEKIPF